MHFETCWSLDIDENANDNIDGIEVLHTAAFPFDADEPNTKDAFDIIKKKKEYQLNRTTTAPLSTHQHKD